MNPAQKQFSTHVSVLPDEGIRVDRAITIRCPIDKAFDFWRRLANLPRFLRHVESLTVRDDRHSHWVVRDFAGDVFRWDIEIIEQRENEMISWRSIPGSDVNHAGSVWFTPVPGENATLVRLELKYVPAQGKAGVAISKLFGQDAGSEIAADLADLKTLLETGQLPEEQPIPPWQKQTVEAAAQAADATDTYIRQHPWQVIACAAGVGFILGLLLLRRRD